jgi:hypothetical protein
MVNCEECGRKVPGLITGTILGNGEVARKMIAGLWGKN